MKKDGREWKGRGGEENKRTLEGLKGEGCRSIKGIEGIERGGLLKYKGN